MPRLQNFVDTTDFTKEELMDIVNISMMMKKHIKNGKYFSVLHHKTLGMIFEQKSTRTRASFETAMTQLGGHAQYYAPGQLQLGAHESLYDTAKVLGRLTDVLMARVIEHKSIVTLAENAGIPVINGMSDYNHPTQEMGDIITMFEHLPEGKEFKDCKVVYMGDCTQVCASLMMIVTKMGGHYVDCGPKDFQLKENYLKIAEENCKISGGSYMVTDDPDVALKDADFVYGDVWYGLYEAEMPKEQRMSIFYPKYQVNMEAIKKCSPNVKYMHCLPATRGEEVTDEVIDSEYSIVFDQAENRLTAMRGLLVYFMDKMDEVKMACQND